ncbi:iron uptake system protein EfeO [uncultured Microbacterium sp.]|uniref:iron uptake system protein EfeO n=1 Tax=uncultured Microbacterium sp. TaxID=191216 RepID=UPI0035CB6D81
MTLRRPLAAIAAVSLASLVLAGCVAKTAGSASASLDVTSTDSTCEVSAATATSGNVTFNVTNNGSDITEFYLLGEDGLQIAGEVENVAPGASRTLSLTAQPGAYFTVCKPGMVGSGVGRAAFSVTGDAVAVSGDDAAQKQQAVTLYAAFVKDQVGQLAPAADTFATAYETGDDAAARQQFANVRAYYERIEPVAEALGDLDPKIDYRELDAVAEGLDWTGFHRIEKDLWVPATDALNADDVTPAWQNWQPSTPEQRAAFATHLRADVQSLFDYVHSDEFVTTLDEQGIAGISNGGISLLDEVATGKITGEEDWWSGTDLYDFAANVEGAKMAFTLVRDFADSKGAEGTKLTAEIDSGFADLDAALAAHGSLATGFVDYRALSEADKRELIDLINALAEPLSQLTGTILS